MTPYTGWATGYDRIPMTIWVCPIHGEVTASQDIPTENGHYHKNCGQWLIKRRRLNSDPPFTS